MNRRVSPVTRCYSHQGFFTREALTAIAETTIHNISSFEESGQAAHQIGTELLA